VSSQVQPTVADDDPPSGETFSQYLLVGEIARGGMGEVLLAVRGLEGASEVVVVKRMLRHLTTNSEFTQMFLDEAQLAAQFEHPNIVKTYEFGEHDGQYFAVMEFLAGEDLGKVLDNLSLRSELMALPVAIHIAAELCSGLHFAHQLTDPAGRPLRLVHRDINPDNIVVTYTGEVKIIDFGVARVDTAATKTVTGMLKGKFAYMAPEYIKGHGCDHRADVFSVGIVLWESLTGRKLFARETTAATMYAVMDAPIPPPSRYRSDVPAELDAIVTRALARSPPDRFDSADEMRRALDELAASLPALDPDAVGRTMEIAFGPIRAQAMRAIKQAQSLARNVALVMKRPAALPPGPLPVGSSPNQRAPGQAAPAQAAPTGAPSRWWPSVVVAVVALGAGVTAAIVTSDRSSSQAAPPAELAVAGPAVPSAGPAVPSAVVVPPPAPDAGAVTLDAEVPVPDAPVADAEAPVADAEKAAPSAAVPDAAVPSVDVQVPVPAPESASSARGRLTVTTRSNAVVSLDGKVIDHGSFTDRPTPSGHHQLVVRVPGRRPVTRSISIIANRETKVEIELAPRSGASGPGHDDPAAHDPPPVAPIPRPVAGVKQDPAGVPPVKPLVLDVAAIRVAVRAQIGAVQQCYERAKMDDLSLQGTVTVRITIAANGAVTHAQVASSTLHAPRVEECITHEIVRWQLPKPGGVDAASFSYPFVFE
jgi:TonB family protein